MTPADFTNDILIGWGGGEVFNQALSLAQHGSVLRAEWDDVDLLFLVAVAKLGNDLLDTASTLTDASAGWVNVFFGRIDGHFGTKASDTGDAFDDDDALIDFVDFLFEESLQEAFGGTGDFDLRSFLNAVDFDALDLLDVDLDGLAWLECRSNSKNLF